MSLKQTPMAQSSSRGSRWSLKGTIAMVTGGTRGIGFSFYFFTEFGSTFYTCSRNEVELNKCLNQWQEKGFSVYGSVCDVSSSSQREELIRKVASAFNGKLNILVNNVGTNLRRPTIEYPIEQYSNLMSINLESAYHLSQLAYSLLKESGNGSIVFNSSVASLTFIGSGTVYVIFCSNMMDTNYFERRLLNGLGVLFSLAGINQLTKGLACEWAKDNKA